MTEHEHKKEIVIAEHFTKLFTRMDDIDKGMDKQNIVLREIKEDGKDSNTKIEAVDDKLGIQNGRVRKLEDWSIEAHRVIESNATILGNYKIDKARLWTAGAILVFLGGAIITLSIMAIDTKIEKGIAGALAEFDKIRIEQQ